MKIIITGGCGFIGHHFVEHVLKNTDWDVVVVDKLSYASYGYDRLRDISVFDDDRVHIVNHDFVNEASVGVLSECAGADYMVHMAAETHVDDSIKDPAPFIMSNVLGTHNAMRMSIALGCKRFLYFSTDEVYGPAPAGVFFKEDSPVNPSNPYAATKLGGGALVNAYVNTYGLPGIISRTMNVFGERQHPQKFIPMCIRRIRDGEKVLLHANEDLSVVGSRVYLHARNASAAVLHLLEHGVLGEVYNIVGDEEVDNLELAQLIAHAMDKPLDYELVDWHSSRPGHDLRYAMDGSKLKATGFDYEKSFARSLRKVVDWTMGHQKWL